MAVYEEIKNAVLELPFETRAKLVEEILNSLESSREEIDAAWRAEIERRVKEVEEGKVELIPGDQVLRELRDQFNIAAHPEVPIPEWHREVLTERLKKYQDNQNGMEWNEFEQEITSELNHPPGE